MDVLPHAIKVPTRLSVRIMPSGLIGLKQGLYGCVAPRNIWMCCPTQIYGCVAPRKYMDVLPHAIYGCVAPRNIRYNAHMMKYNCALEAVGPLFT